MSTDGGNRTAARGTRTCVDGLTKCDTGREMYRDDRSCRPGDRDALTRNRNGFRSHGECGLGPLLCKPICRLTDEWKMIIRSLLS